MTIPQVLLRLHKVVVEIVKAAHLGKNKVKKRDILKCFWRKRVEPTISVRLQSLKKVSVLLELIIT